MHADAHRRDVDDAAAAGVGHGGDEAQEQADGAEVVDVDGALEVLRPVELQGERAADRLARVVDHDVGRAVSADDRGREVLDRARIREIGGEDVGGAARRPDPRGDLLEPVGGARDEQDGGAGGGEELGGGGAEPERGAGDQDRAPGHGLGETMRIGLPAWAGQASEERGRGHRGSNLNKVH